MITSSELDSLFSRIATPPNKAKSILADLLRLSLIGANDLSRLEDELNNAFTLIHTKGVPFSGFRLVQSVERGHEGEEDEDRERERGGDRDRDREGERERKIVKVDMTEDAIRFLCQQGDSEDQGTVVHSLSQQNGHHGTPVARSVDGLPVSFHIYLIYKLVIIIIN